VISRRRLWIFVAAFLGILTVGATTLALRIPFTSETLRTRVVETLSDRLDAEVELGDLTLCVLPALHAEGTDLRIRHKGRRDVPPLISIDKFTVDADLLGLWRNHVAHVNLDELDIQIPPRDHDPDDDHKSDARVEDGDQDADDGDSPERDIVIDELVADEATLTILPRKAGKRPKVWQMHELHMQSVGALTKMPFRSVLTNAVPPGQITTTGSFGPWKKVDPGLNATRRDLHLRERGPGRLQGYLRHPVRARQLRRTARTHRRQRRDRHAELRRESRRPHGAAQDEVPCDCGRHER
jgi:hypothetical protein